MFPHKDRMSGSIRAFLWLMRVVQKYDGFTDFSIRHAHATWGSGFCGHDLPTCLTFREFRVSQFEKMREFSSWQGLDLEVHAWSTPVWSLPENQIKTGLGDPILALSSVCSRSDQVRHRSTWA
jgi:hypothetical protein